LKKLKAELLLLLVATIWAGTFPIIKISLPNVQPFTFLGTRFLIAAIIFTLIFYKKLSFTRKEMMPGILLGSLQFIGFSTQTVGMLYTTATNSALITGVNIMLVPFVQKFLSSKPVKLENWIGVLIVTGGFLFLTLPAASSLNKGDLITLICAFAWAFYIVYVDIFTTKFNIYNMIFIQLWFVGIVSLPISFLLEAPVSVPFTTEFLFSILYMSIFATLITTILVNKYQKETTPIRATIIFSWEQPAAVILSVLFIAELISFHVMMGGLLIVAGILFSETFYYFRIKKIGNN